MGSLLLVILYVVFISLGLPDSLLGSAWPAMRGQIDAPLSYAGVISMIIAGGTIVSSLLAHRLLNKMGTGLVTAVSVLLTAMALFGFSFSSAFWMLCLWAVPYGLGAGAVDAAVNHFAALYLSSRHMNWLHCCWGVGAAISPAIMGHALTNNLGWESGYRTVAIIQTVLTAVLFLSLPLWRRSRTDASAERADSPAPTLRGIIRLPGVPFVLLAFFGYCALEATTGLWASTYLALNRGVAPDIAARYASLFFLGITGGRFLGGCVSDRIGDKNMIRLGLVVIFAGVLAIGSPFGPDWLCLAGLMIVGLGGAPIYPCIIHATPFHFGADKSQAIIGLQMASAYTGTTFMPPLFGVVADRFGVGLLPVFLLVFTALMLFMTEKLNRVSLSKSS